MEVRKLAKRLNTANVFIVYYKYFLCKINPPFMLFIPFFFMKFCVFPLFCKIKITEKMYKNRENQRINFP